MHKLAKNQKQKCQKTWQNTSKRGTLSLPSVPGRDMHTQALQNLGLSEKAVQIYLATLALGTASVQDIAKKSGLKRPTVYVHLEELERHGLISKFPLGKKEYLKASDPKKLEARAESQLSEIRKIIPDLLGMQNTVAGKPQVTVLEGRRALNEVYDEICQANQIRFWSDLKEVESHFAQTFIKIAEAVNTNEIKCREIIDDTKEARASSKRYAVTAGKTYSSRVSTLPGIKNDNAIYGDTVAMFRIHQNNLFVILIKEPTIAETMRTMFDMAWESATPFVGR